MATKPAPATVEKVAIWLMLIGLAVFTGWLLVAVIRDCWLLILVLTS